MKNVSNKFILGAIGFFCILIVGLTAGWFLTCGLYWLVTLCFGWEFSWLTGTGIYILLIAVKLIARQISKAINKD